MSKRTILDYAATRRFEPIVLDHLAGEPFLKEFVTHPFDRDGLDSAARTRTFSEGSRSLLVRVLKEQYRGRPQHEAVRTNLERLARPGTLTVTTGHQLCLFTGPLYVPFKILNTIRLARDLSTSERGVVPVFWMATEDHDRAEIDHAWIGGNRVHWPGASGGPVGRMSLEGMNAVVEEAIAAMGQGPYQQVLADALRACYTPSNDLAQATRAFVDHLFGRFGVLVIDGDDPELKRAFAPIMSEEILNGITERTVAYADERLRDRYTTQAHARPINLFHLHDGMRSRIVPAGDGFQVLDDGPHFDLDGLLNELDAHPERFSPNVLMRPLFQEHVLPNIAMVGGGGEIAYWLQLRWLFQAVQLHMPVLALRTSALIMPARDQQRLAEMGLDVQDLFAPPDEVKTRLARSAATFRTELALERASLSSLYEDIAAQLRAADPTLEASVRGEAQRALKGLDHIEQKLVRAAKRQQEQVLQRLERIHAHAFPGGELQERRENILPWLVRSGPDLLDELLVQLDPLDKRFTILTLDQ